MKKIYCLLFMYMLFAYAGAQEHIYIDGRVVNEKKEPLAGSTIAANEGEYFAVSDPDGYFRIATGTSDSIRITVSFIGYEPYQRWLKMPEEGEILIIALDPGMHMLDEVSIINDFAAGFRKEATVKIEVADREFISRHRGGSLMSSINSIPGISSIDIGSGHSKPLVRGLGFNRVVVTEHGIRHEGQQWGADHGLEIDQYAVDRVEIVKGPASVMYGSDAIGGVLRIYQDHMPAENSLGGTVELSGSSNNNLLGGSAFVSGRSKDIFFTTRFTMLDYADYRIPADNVEVYSYVVPLNEGRLRNTAGNEMNFHASAGLVKPGFFARVFLSHISSKGGFFANAHGLEPRRVDMDLYDRSDREILFPSHDVSHFKLTGLTRYERGSYRLETEFGFQNNFRQEKNHYVNHGYMPARFPGTMESPQYLERQFNKDIFSLNIRNYFQAGRIHNLSAGLNAQYQQNRIGGYAFIIPQFEQLDLGAYLYDKIMIGYRTWLHAGIRIDNGVLKTKEYTDWFPTPVPDQMNGEADQVYLKRSEAINRTFNSLSMSLGINRNTGRVALMANIGKGFRMPTAKEVAANGVNYHYFRYEKGNPSLKAEDSWQADLNLEYSNSNFGFQISPFLNYFPGYIYLDPSYRHDYLYGAGNQIFEYTQNEVLRFGGEVRITCRPFRFLRAELAGDYVYSEQLSGNKKGFSIPFSPPPSVKLDIKYSPRVRGSLQNPFIGAEAGLTGSQERIVPPEKATPAYELVHLTMGGDLIWDGQPLNFSFRIHNLLDRKYLNHLSYYRLIGAPEPGRNFVFSLRVPFGN